MRIRQVKPSFWKDPRIADMPEGVRLFYIGLWMLADDEGWYRWDCAEAGTELYGYEPRKRRERQVVTMLDRLIENGRVVAYPCGHILVPHLKEHQHLAGSTKQVKTYLNQHLKSCPSLLTEVPREPPRTPADTRGDPTTPATLSKGKRLGDGQERSVKERVDGGQSDFDRAMAAGGINPAIVGRA